MDDISTNSTVSNDASNCIISSIELSDNPPAQPVNVNDWQPSIIPSLYVLCHPEMEKDRFHRLVPHLIMRGIPKSCLRFVAPTWGETLTNDLIFKVYNPYLSRGNIPSFTFKAACLSKGEISLILNFYSAIQHAVANNTDNQAVLVLESDAHLRRDFVPRLSKILQDLSGQDWDYVSLGEGVGTRPPGCDKSYFGEQKLYAPPHAWVFRCTDSMLLSHKFAKKLSQTLIPFKECLDWELNFQIAFHGGKALWADPPIAEQGTYFSRYITSLS